MGKIPEKPGKSQKGQKRQKRKDKSQKNPRVRKIFCPQFWGRKWVRQFYGRLEYLLSFCRKKLHVHKIPRFRGGGVFWVFFWGGECRFYFYGRGDFSESPVRETPPFETPPPPVWRPLTFARVLTSKAQAHPGPLLSAGLGAQVPLAVVSEITLVSEIPSYRVVPSAGLSCY